MQPRRKKNRVDRERSHNGQQKGKDFEDEGGLEFDQVQKDVDQQLQKLDGRNLDEAESLNCKIRAMCISIVVLIIALLGVAAFYYLPQILEAKDDGPQIIFVDRAPSQPSPP